MCHKNELIQLQRCETSATKRGTIVIYSVLVPDSAAHKENNNAQKLDRGNQKQRTKVKPL